MVLKSGNIAIVQAMIIQSWFSNNASRRIQGLSYVHVHYINYLLLILIIYILSSSFNLQLSFLFSFFLSFVRFFVSLFDSFSCIVLSIIFYSHLTLYDLIYFHYITYKNHIMIRHIRTCSFVKLYTYKYICIYYTYIHSSGCS